MQRSKKDTYILLALIFGFLIGTIMLLIGFIPQRDLKDYQRLTDGGGKTVQAVSTGGVSKTISGRRGGSQQFCTSWRYEVDGNERFFTDRLDCYTSAEAAPSGTEAELIYDPNDLGTTFVHSDQTLEKLESSKVLMRVISIVGGIILVACIGLLVMKRRGGKKPTATSA